MIGLFKCLAVLCAVSVARGFTDVRDDVAWFKNDGRIKNKFVSGVVNGILDADCSVTMDGEAVQGECMPKVECNKVGGEAGGLCSLMGSCCVVKKTCSETTAYKISYFVPPKQFQSHCSLIVKKYSSDVCQLRLDFEKFDLAQPEASGQSGHHCVKDKFSVEGINKKPGFKSLCGKNKNQHIYVPMSKAQSQLTLRFQLTSGGEEGENPDWKIKITQLECRQSADSHFLNAPSKLMAIHNNLKQKVTPKCLNCDLIAPPGCLQYYTNDTGTFQSFNYNGGKGPYLADLDYAVCFKQTSEVCGAQFTPVKFQMNENAAGENKCHHKQKASATVSQDYIRIPGGVNGTEYDDFYCGAGPKTTILARSYEPLYVGVHTDTFLANSADAKKEAGFQIKYELLRNECYPPSV